MAKSTIKSIIDSFDLKAAYEASKTIYEREINKDKSSYKCEKAEQAAKILNDSVNFNDGQKAEIAALLSLFTEEEIVIFDKDDDDSKKLHAGVFLKLLEDCGNIEEGSVIFLEEDKDNVDDFVGRYEDGERLEENNFMSHVYKYEHPTFEEVEEFFNNLKDSQKILLISAIMESQK